MADRLEVAVQVEDDVGVDGESEERLAQGSVLAVRRQVRCRLAQRISDERHVPVRVGTVLRADPRGHGLGEVGPAAVEVGQEIEVVAARMAAHDRLTEPDRVRHRNDDDLAGDFPFRLRRLQQRTEQGERHDAGQLVAVEARLQIGLGPGARLTEGQNLQAVPRARRRARQVDGPRAHEALRCRSAARD